MTTGYLALVLHAHLPFVRHPDDETAMEHQWLNEAITETYLPLVRLFEGLVQDGVRYRATLSLSAPLITMLTDEWLERRYATHLDRLIELTEREAVRNAHEPQALRLSEMYRDTFLSLRHTWQSHGGNLIAAFRNLSEKGGLEVITSTATHAFFPALDRNWAAMRAQIHTAADLYERHFGRRTPGMWLGECGYVPACDELLREAGVRYFFVDSHALLLADSQPVHGVHAPIYCPTGVAAFARDPECSEQVWSAEAGYPGDRLYRDFYRDIGFDLPLDYIGPYVHAEGHRTHTGIKYHAITHDHLHDKKLYDPAAARSRVGEHAAHFRAERTRQIRALAAKMDRPPVLVSPFDAELFGHWWFEGVQFLDDLWRQLHFDQGEIETVAPTDYLDRHPTNQVATPSLSSWGHRGYGDYWINETNAWMYRHVHVAGERMTELARKFPAATGLTARALRQAARELLLLQSSDFAFIMTTRTTVSYAERRVTEHILRFNRLYEGLIRGSVDEAFLAWLEREDDIFPELDYSLYAT